EAAPEAADETRLALRVAVPVLNVDRISRVGDERAAVAVAVRVSTAIFPPGQIARGSRRRKQGEAALYEARSGAKSAEPVPEGHDGIGRLIPAGNRGRHIGHSLYRNVGWHTGQHGARPLGTLGNESIV